MAASPAAQLRYFSAIEVVSAGAGEYVVLADTSCPIGEEVTFHEPSLPGRPRSVRIEGCRPVLVNDRLRYEMRLKVEDTALRLGAGA
jgi:hypothetical protein